jgi:hypothetical protein
MEQRKRPWYLIAALLGALAYGVGGSCDGLREATISRDLSQLAASGAVNSAEVLAALEKHLEVLDATKSRSFPLHVAAILLGAAMVVYAFRAMAGRPDARGPLLQLIVVQAALGIATFFLLKDVRHSQLALWATEVRTHVKESPDPRRAEHWATMMITTRAAFQPVYLIFHTLGSLAFVFALTRPRTRAFYEAAPDPVEQ